MKISSLTSGLCLLVFLSAGCVSTQPAGKTASINNPLAQQYFDKGSAFEKQGDLTRALEQYTLALTVDASHGAAARQKQILEGELRKRAEDHYQAGLKLDKEGRPDQARKEYLAALQNWPDHDGANTRLTSGNNLETDKYIVHEIGPGESVSKLSKIYYGNYKKYPVISLFNQMKDATQTKIGQKVRIPEINGVSLAELQAVQKRYLAAKASGDTGAIEAMTQYEETAESDSKPVPTRIEAKPADVPMTVPQPEPAANPAKPAETLAALPPAKTTGPKTVDVGEEVSVYLGHGLELLDKKQYLEAIVELGKAVEADPANAAVKANLFEAHFQQGLLQFNKEEYLEARKHFETAYRFNKTCINCPDYVQKCTDTYKEKHYSMGIQYFGKEQLKEAINEWQLVEAVDPNYKELGANLKKALLLFDRLEKIKKGQTP